MGDDGRLRLIDDEALERSSTVANCLMNRERRLPGYNRELGLDILAELRSRRRPGTAVRWLDLCCGTANALLEASADFGAGIEIVGVDLVDFFSGASRPPGLALITSSIAAWEPQGVFDLITCVHGLHYVGDKLATIRRAASWLAEDGLFVANFDARSVRLADGTPAGPRLPAALRAAGLNYDPRNRRIRCEGARTIELPYAYAGSDDQAGPNYTGQPAVNSHYDYQASARTRHTPHQ
ncbi:methyltransferase [Acrocarpospora corrugata]|uniref:Methyltransferase n=1 Tax=Acrocarpospora corrugata TaxID=35763 RepID=A0A5M3W601_9ACTN|nr:methyltransferase [Acrocarpospora corrugata]